MSIKEIFIVASVILLENSEVHSQLIPKQTFSLSYFGETVVHPGICIDFLHKILQSNNKDIHETKHLLQGGINFSFYAHRKSHVGITAMPQLGYQFLFKKGLVLRTFLGAGYLKQINYGKTYEVLDDNTINSKKWASRNKFTSSLSIGLGQNLLKRKNIPFGWHFDLGIFTEAPTNTGWVPHSFVKTGVDYYLNLNK